MRYTYPCVLTPELDDGGFSVSFPDVPEALTGGDDRAQALEKATDALAVALSFYVDGRREIPVPSDGLRAVGRGLIVGDRALTPASRA